MQNRKKYNAAQKSDIAKNLFLINVSAINDCMRIFNKFNFQKKNQISIVLIFVIAKKLATNYYSHLKIDFEIKAKMILLN